MYVRIEHCDKVRHTFMVPVIPFHSTLATHSHKWYKIIEWYKIIAYYLLSVDECIFYVFQSLFTIFTIIILVLLFRTKISDIEKKRKNKEFP